MTKEYPEKTIIKIVMGRLGKLKHCSKKDIAIKVIVAYDTTNFGTLQILRKK